MKRHFHGVLENLNISVEISQIFPARRMVCSQILIFWEYLTSFIITFAFVSYSWLHDFTFSFLRARTVPLEWMTDEKWKLKVNVKMNTFKHFFYVHKNNVDLRRQQQITENEFHSHKVRTVIERATRPTMLALLSAQLPPIKHQWTKTCAKHFLGHLLCL